MNNLSMHTDARLPRAPADSAPTREWLATIDLEYQIRHPQNQVRSTLVNVAHQGPLRVQRPFYPESDGTCHTYLLHPPGGMAVGDRLGITARLDTSCSVLVTTPSAGKMYGSLGVEGAEYMPQVQTVNIHCGAETIMEWLPQETIIFDGAQANLESNFYLEEGTKFIGWDIVRLGRAASGERFDRGYCTQRLNCFRGGQLIFRELNDLKAGAELMSATWGLQGKITLATMLATVELNRDQVDELYTLLPNKHVSEDAINRCWGLTQKQDLFIARYLGNSILDCREGMQIIWQYLRPLTLNKTAVVPRIWNT